MLVMRTTEDPADPLGKLVSAQQTLGLDHFSLAVNPLGLYGVKPRTLLGQKTTYDSHSGFGPALFDTAIVPAEPAPEIFGDMPTGVVPDEKQDLLASRLELLRAPRKKLCRYAAHSSAIHESQPRIIEFGQIKSVAGNGLRLGVVFGDRLLDEAKGLSFFRPATQGRQSQPAPPALVLEAYCPFGVGPCHLHQSVAPSFFLSYRGSGEVIQRFARCHLTPRRRMSVARIVSPETRFGVIPSSKATSEAMESVHRLLCRPNSLGERCKSPLKASALCSSKASRVRRGREDLAARASVPLALKSWMASRTVCCPQPRFSAIRGTSLPFEEARSICERRRVKASLERSPAWRV